MGMLYVFPACNTNLCPLMKFQPKIVFNVHQLLHKHLTCVSLSVKERQGAAHDKIPYVIFNNNFQINSKQNSPLYITGMVPSSCTRCCVVPSLKTG